MTGPHSESIESLKREQEIVATERNKLSNILSGITNAVIAVDLEGNIVLFNKAAESLIGIGDVAGASIDSILKLYKDKVLLAPDEYCPIQMDTSEGSVYSANDVKLVRTDGKERYVNVVAGHIREGKQINLGCILTLQDITREHIMEKTKREFVSIAAHQLRTPLTGVTWALESLAGKSENSDESQKQLIVSARDAVHRMVGLVNDLLDVTRIEEGRFGVKMTNVSIGELLDTVLKAFEKNAADRKIRLVHNIPALPHILADANKIEMVISNLLDNALKYTKEGGTVTLAASMEGSDILIRVQDTGIGIPAHEFERIFSKFYRSKQAVSNFTDGSGLGLFVAKNIIDQHNGKMWFESQEGKGTTFSILLPAVA